MKAKRWISGLVFVMLGSAAARAQATTYWQSSGVSCQGDSESVTAHSFRGTLNYDTTSGHPLECPISYPPMTATTHTVSSIVMFVDDFSTTDAVSCTAYQVFGDGTSYFSSTKASCSTTGGCVSGTGASFTGSNILQWTAADLGANLTTQYVVAGYGLNCWLPAETSQASRMKLYYMTY